MDVSDQVALSLLCIGCKEEKEAWIPRERGISPGRYIWLCAECQVKGQIAGGITKISDEGEK